MTYDEREALLEAHLRLGGAPRFRLVSDASKAGRIPVGMRLDPDPSRQWRSIRWVIAEPGGICVGVLGRCLVGTYTTLGRARPYYAWVATSPVQVRYPILDGLIRDDQAPAQGGHVFQERTRQLVLMRLGLVCFAARGLDVPVEVTRAALALLRADDERAGVIKNITSKMWP